MECLCNLSIIVFLLCCPAWHCSNRGRQRARTKHPSWYRTIHRCFQRNPLRCQAGTLWETQSSPWLGRWVLTADFFLFSPFFLIGLKWLNMEKKNPPGILKATEFSAKCLQLSPSMTHVLGSEDCLYLNIWVPHGPHGNSVADCSLVTYFSPTLVTIENINRRLCLC